MVSSIDKVDLTGKVNDMKAFKSFVQNALGVGQIVWAGRGSKPLDMKCPCLNRVYGQYRHSITVRYGDEEGWVFIRWCSVSRSNHMNERCIRMEFNPNKTSLGDDILRMCKVKVQTLHSLDVAFDFTGKRAENVILNSGREDFMVYGANGVYTQYLAPKARSGRVKVYQKDVERAKVGQSMKSPLLRIEVTVNGGDIIPKRGLRVTDKMRMDWADAESRLGRLRYKGGETDDAFLFLLKAVDEETRKEALHMVGSQKRAKYRALLLDVCNVLADSWDVKGAVLDYVEMLRETGNV